ncbi:hypothetical protein CHLRE_02g142800v5 [Chlamydomonas reinhardtii]|uniref:Uncharacterized protein n=1 Tax=Chlamydomonas reinhardtii TaxID=3055 RepID=A8J0Q8_CHLRE|nr:uncharacterized protein CHLRE_02g142800v5 [Chlamydomonas reinhardtii]PNW87525.1 hypothetical protein CHLRE_02g142800v5 [Chlamydomonas reinhardtii]|eukprot:XP_001694975.1 thioredoxin-related protein CITRX [Chlamydomonas reinhardtii]
MHTLSQTSSRATLSARQGRKAVALGSLPKPVVAARVPVASPVSQRGAPGVTCRRSVISHGKVEKISGEQLEVAIASRDTTLIVDFFATWCGPCLLLARELEQVAEEMDGRVKVVKIDVDENPDLSNMLRIQGLPTIVIIPKDAGKPALRTEGFLPAAQIMEIVGQIEAGQTPGQPQQPEAPQQ